MSALTAPERGTGAASTPTRVPGLTVRGVKCRLGRAGIDHSALTICEREEVSRTVDIGVTGPWRLRTVVIVSGPREVRRRAFHVLWAAGLSCALYHPDHDEWFR